MTKSGNMNLQPKKKKLNILTKSSVVIKKENKKRKKIVLEERIVKKDERVRDRKRIKDKDREAEFELTRNNVNSQPSPSTSNNIIELKGHSKDVFLCAWNPKDTNILATCSLDGTSRIWNITNWQKDHAQPTLIKSFIKNNLSDVCWLDWNPTEANTILLRMRMDFLVFIILKQLPSKFRAWDTVGQYKHEI
ncbi:unnamed protein product [Rhizophagus irregularis]|nr:unnamed protein product [Rhizophagus irregularis]